MRPFNFFHFLSPSSYIFHKLLRCAHTSLSPRYNNIFQDRNSGLQQLHLQARHIRSPASWILAHYNLLPFTIDNKHPQSNSKHPLSPSHRHVKIMDFEAATQAAPIDPQLDMLDAGNAAESMQYQFSASFEPWNSMFESMGGFSPEAAQDVGVMDSDFVSDSASSVTYTDQGFQFSMSPPEAVALMKPDESSAGTSISAASEPGSGSGSGKDTKKAASKAKGSGSGKRGPRRARSETEKREQIKQRNRVAASKCRQKKKEKVDELKEIKSSLEARNTDLHMEYQRLRREIGHVKSDLIRHTECNDPNISRWVENEAKGYVQKLVQNGERQRMASFSGGQMHPADRHSEDLYMGLGQPSCYANGAFSKINDDDE